MKHLSKVAKKQAILLPVFISVIVLMVSQAIAKPVDNSKATTANEMNRKNVAADHIISVDYLEKINNLRKGFPPEDNADADYRKAIDLYRHPSDDIYNLFGCRIRPSKRGLDDLPNEQRKALEQWITQNKAALAQFTQATQKPYYQPHYTGKTMVDADISMGINELGELSAALCWRVQFHISNGAVERGIKDIICCLRFGNHMSSGPKPLISFKGGYPLQGYRI